MTKLKSFDTNQIAKGERLLNVGDLARFAYRVESGCLKSYVLDHTGKQHILQFAPENWLIGDMDSSTNKKPSVVYIDAIEDSVVSFISTNQIGDMSHLEQEVLLEMTIKMRNNLIATNRRIISLLSATAEARYVEFTEIYPTLIQRLPLKLIASYIGITPEYLSELRRKIAKRG